MEIEKQEKSATKFLIPALYLAVMVLVVLGIWKEQNAVRKGGDGPLYRNLMEGPAWARRGFDQSDILEIPSVFPSEGWVRFGSPPLRISNTSLSDLPARPYLSPWGREAEEFTILIAVEMDNRAITFLDSGISIMPGIFFGYIGENWEVYFNGKLIAREMHTDETGRIKSRRNWRDVSLPFDKSLIAAGTNILALRILGDPAYDVTGFYYTAPYYLDDYQIIQKRQQNILLLVLCTISGFLGLYFLFLFLSVRRKHEIIYLYYGIFSVLFCVYSIARNGLVNALIPNSDISIRMEYLALFLMVTVLCFFTEMIGRGKITIISKAYMAFCLLISITQMFFSTQYGDDVLKIWSVTILIYFSYVFFYDVIYFFFRSRSKNENVETTMIHIMFGAGLMYACGIFDVLDVLFFHRSFSLFIYSTFVVHFGLAVTLLWRFNGMYKQLEESNVVLETTVKERTQKLEEQTAIAVRANRAKSDFLAVMSHEIRTPLNAVISLSETELRSGYSESSRENIAQIHQSGSFLLGIIGDILDISKIEEGKFELVPVKYDTAAMISAIVNINMIRLASKPVRFILDIDGDFPAQLTGDELRVKQILNNLLSNAVKYTAEGTIQLTVKNEQQTGENTLVRFMVRDTGIGIRAEDMGKLFDNYVRLDSKANRSAEGTGLGLSITKNLTAMMGGGISVESEYGKGSVFTAKIVQGIENGEPYCKPIGEETAESLRNFHYYAGEWQEEAFRHSSIPPAKVLVVDDKPENLLAARGLLKPYGLIMDTASSGQEAIAKTQTAHYDLIFMDHMMPEMDGVEAAAAIRDREKAHGEKTAPVIALTAVAVHGMKEYYLEHGFDDYLSKPINVQELDKVLVKWLGAARNQDDSIAAGLRPDDNPQSPFSFAIESQRLDKLNHYRLSFEIGKKFDTAYFERFTALIRSFGFRSAALQEQAALLIESGQKGDAQKIREMLPAFCGAALQEAEKKQQEDSGASAEPLDEMLSRLKKAIQDGDGTAEAILGGLGQARLDPDGQELYFTIYDLLLKNDTEKAIAAIANYIGEVSND